MHSYIKPCARTIVPLALALLVAGVLSAIIYQRIGDPPAIAEAASIVGTVFYEGKPARMRPLPVEGDPNCAKMHKDEPLMTEWLLLGEGQTVANSFVQITKGLPTAKTYPVPQEAAELTQSGCQYAPHVLAVRGGQTIKILNPDAMQHNVHAMSKVNREFNKAMAKTHTELRHTFEKPEPIFKVKCDVHGWMEAFIAVVAHPFFDVTEADGAFTIEGLAPGEYEIEAWHEVLGTRTATVKVAEGEDAVVNFTFTRPKR